MMDGSEEGLFPIFSHVTGRCVKKPDWLLP